MNSTRRVDRRLLTILLIVFVQIVGAGMVLPILPLVAKRQFAMSDQVITLLIASFFAAQFLAGPLLGRWSDLSGRLPVLIISQIGTAISFVMLALAQGVPMLFAARILDGITGGNIIVAQAYITDITPREKRTQSLGYIFAAFGLGFVFGPAAGGLLSAAFGTRVPFLIAAAATLATVLITRFALDETVTSEMRADQRSASRPRLGLRQVVGNRALMLVIFIAFVGQFGFGLLQSTFALFGDAVIYAGNSPERITLYVGLLLAVVGLTQVLTQTLVLRRLVHRLGDSRMVVLGSLVRAAGMAVFAFLTAAWQAPLGSVLFAFGMGVMMPPLQSLATRAVDDRSRGAVLGAYQSAISLAIIFSTAVAGSFFARDPRLPYKIGAILSALAALPALWLVIRPLDKPRLDVSGPASSSAGPMP